MQKGGVFVFHPFVTVKTFTERGKKERKRKTEQRSKQREEKKGRKRGEEREEEKTRGRQATGK
jgi:hypothetical protein